MKELTEAIIGLLDLAEAEGRLLQHKMLQTTAMVLMFLAAALLMMVAVGFFLAVIYQVLKLYLQMPWVLLVMGLICLLFSGVIVWFAMHINRRQ